MTIATMNRYYSCTQTRGFKKKTPFAFGFLPLLSPSASHSLVLARFADLHTAARRPGGWVSKARRGPRPGGGGAELTGSVGRPRDGQRRAGRAAVDRGGGVHHRGHRHGVAAALLHPHALAPLLHRRARAAVAALPHPPRQSVPLLHLTAPPRLVFSY